MYGVLVRVEGWRVLERCGVWSIGKSGGMESWRDVVYGVLVRVEGWRVLERCGVWSIGKSGGMESFGEMWCMEYW